MPDAPPPVFPGNTSPERRSSVTETALALVASVVHDWRRALVLVGVGAAGLVGFIVYEGRERFTAALLAFASPPAVVLRADRVPALTAELRAGLPDARAVLVWGVEANANRRTLVGFAADAEVTTALQPVLGRLRLGVPLFRAATGAQDVNALVLVAINGGVPCGPPPWPAWQKPDGSPPPFTIGAVCLAGIPPGPGALVGLLEVAFSTAPDAPLLDALRPALWNAAARLAGRNGSPFGGG